MRAAFFDAHLYIVALLVLLAGHGSRAADFWGAPPGVQGAAESDASPLPGQGAGWELSPNLGMMGGSALLGIKASMTYRPVTFEAAADQVMGRAATLYPFTVNAVLDLARPSRVVPFAVVGGGLFLTVPSNSVGNETVTSMGLNFGGGLRFYLNRFLGVRFETKQLFTKVENRLDEKKRNELLIFQSTSLGVIFAFD